MNENLNRDERPRNVFVNVNVVSMKVRPGTRQGYIEVLLVTRSGNGEASEAKKFVMKKVDRFWSEQGSVDELI